MGLLDFVKLFVNLTKQHWNLRLLWHNCKHVIKFSDCLIVSLKFDESVRFLESVQTILRVELFRFLEVVQCLCELSACCQCYTHE